MTSDLKAAIPVFGELRYNFLKLPGVKPFIALNAGKFTWNTNTSTLGRGAAPLDYTDFFYKAKHLLPVKQV